MNGKAQEKRAVSSKGSNKEEKSVKKAVTRTLLLSRLCISF
jgi:hypothetical protein